MDDDSGSDSGVSLGVHVETDMGLAVEVDMEYDGGDEDAFVEDEDEVDLESDDECKWTDDDRREDGGMGTLEGREERGLRLRDDITLGALEEGGGDGGYVTVHR